MTTALSIDTDPYAHEFFELASEALFTLVRAIAHLLDLHPPHIDREGFSSWVDAVCARLPPPEREVLRAGIGGTNDLEDAVKVVTTIGRAAGCHPSTLPGAME